MLTSWLRERSLKPRVSRFAFLGDGRRGRPRTSQGPSRRRVVRTPMFVARRPRAGARRATAASSLSRLAWRTACACQRSTVAPRSTTAGCAWRRPRSPTHRTVSGSERPARDRRTSSAKAQAAPLCAGSKLGLFGCLKNRWGRPVGCWKTRHRRDGKALERQEPSRPRRVGRTDTRAL